MDGVAAVHVDGGPREQNEGAGRWGQSKASRAECVLELVTTLGNTACSCRGPCEEPCGPLYLTYIAMEVKVKVKSPSHVQLFATHRL